MIFEDALSAIQSVPNKLTSDIVVGNVHQYYIVHTVVVLQQCTMALMLSEINKSQRGNLFCLEISRDIIEIYD